MSKPKLSIVSITYNHGKYIREALQSFVDQKTNFDFEIIVADDCSTDKTPDIIREFERKYPKLFKSIIRQKNVGVQENLYDALRAAEGQYIALCEGDDYWTDSQKLQLQVDFLDANPEYALCFHPVKVFYENGQKDNHVYPSISDKSKFTVRELLRGNFIQTNSVVYRKQNYTSMPANILPLDWYLHLYHAQFGKIGFIEQTMSAYRRHPGGIWWESDRNKDELWKKHGLSQLRLYKEFLKLYGDKSELRKIINDHINNMFNNLIEVDSKHGEELVNKAVLEIPETAKVFVTYQIKEMQVRDEELHKRNTRITALEQENQHKYQQLKQKDDEINTIKSSKFWKLRNLIAGLVGKSKL